MVRLPEICRGSYFLLLVSLLLLGLLYPLLGLGDWGARIWLVSFWTVLLGAVWAVHRHRIVLRVAKVLAGLAIALGVLGLSFSIAPLAGPGRGAAWFGLLVGLANLAFLSFVTWVVLLDVLRGTRVDTDKILGAVCVYLLIGLAFAESFVLLGDLYAMAGAEPDLGGRADAMYFSFVTLTTLGYGDVVPRSDPMRVLAPLEAIVGQLYLTILVARLVGLHISQSGRFERE